MLFSFKTMISVLMFFSLINCSMEKVKVLDASRPPGHPSLLLRSSDAVFDIGISSASFSPDGDVLCSILWISF